MKSRFFTLNKSDLKFAFSGAIIGLPIGAAFGLAKCVAIDIVAMHDYVLNYGDMTSSDIKSRSAQWALKHDRDAFILDGQVYYNRKTSFSTKSDFVVPLVFTVATTAALGIATRRFGLFTKKIVNSWQEKYSINNRK